MHKKILAIAFALAMSVGSSSVGFAQQYGSVRVNVDPGSSSQSPHNPYRASVVKYTGPGPWSYVAVDRFGQARAWFLPGESPIELKEQVQNLKKAHQNEVAVLRDQVASVSDKLKDATEWHPKVVIAGQPFEVTNNGNLVTHMPERQMLALLQNGYRKDPSRVAIYGHKGKERFVSTSGSGAQAADLEKGFEHGCKDVKPVGELDGRIVFVYIPPTTK
jgi:hypothetical protein